MMAPFLLILLIATSVVSGNFPYGNLDKDFIWDVRRCSNINPIADVGTIILNAKGRYPNDQMCHAIRRDMKVGDGRKYEMSVEFLNLASGTGRCRHWNTGGRNNQCGHIGLIFNYWDQDNYDFIMRRHHSFSRSYMRGKVQNGIFVPTEQSPACGNLARNTWHTLKIVVNGGGGSDTGAPASVTVTTNGGCSATFNARFGTRGYGGVHVFNGFLNTVKFRNFDVRGI